MLGSSILNNNIRKMFTFFIPYVSIHYVCHGVSILHLTPLFPNLSPSNRGLLQCRTQGPCLRSSTRQGVNRSIEERVRHYQRTDSEEVFARRRNLVWTQVRRSQTDPWRDRPPLCVMDVGSVPSTLHHSYTKRRGLFRPTLSSRKSNVSPLVGTRPSRRD